MAIFRVKRLYSEVTNIIGSRVTKMAIFRVMNMAGPASRARPFTPSRRIRRGTDGRNEARFAGKPKTLQQPRKANPKYNRQTSEANHRHPRTIRRGALHPARSARSARATFPKSPLLTALPCHRSGASASARPVGGPGEPGPASRSAPRAPRDRRPAQPNLRSWASSGPRSAPLDDPPPPSAPLAE